MIQRLGPGLGEFTQNIDGSFIHNRVERQKVECEEAERSQTDLVLGFICQELRSLSALYRNSASGIDLHRIATTHESASVQPPFLLKDLYPRSIASGARVRSARSRSW